MAIKQKPKRVLTVIAILLLVSAGMRLATGMGPAIAFAEEQLAQQDADPAAEEAAGFEVEPLIAALRAREERVAARETAIEDRLRALSVAEDELTKRLGDLEAAEASLTAALTLSETANDSDIARLTAVYENMKPVDAASLFEEMAPDFASGFFVRMRPEAAAAIMTGLEPQTAYSISVIIAGRNANAPTE
jgi:flagellar motility protein MotE (MotC chaperone)